MKSASGALRLVTDRPKASGPHPDPAGTSGARPVRLVGGPADVESTPAGVASDVREEHPDQLADHDDVDLVSRIGAGSQAAFEALTRRYQDRIFRLVGRFSRDPQEVEDIVQDVFVKVYRRLETFTFQASFYTWLYRIAVNTATDAAHRTRRNPVHHVEDPAAWQDQARSSSPGTLESTSPDAELLADEVREATRRVLQTLPDKFRTILILREYEDLAYEEIAQVLDISIGTVESRLFRARARFRDKIQRMYPGLIEGT